MTIYKKLYIFIHETFLKFTVCRFSATLIGGDTMNCSKRQCWSLDMIRLCSATALHDFHCMMASWHGNPFRITGPLRWKPSVTGGFPSPHKGPVIIIFLTCWSEQAVEQTVLVPAMCNWLTYLWWWVVREWKRSRAFRYMHTAVVKMCNNSCYFMFITIEHHSPQPQRNGNILLLINIIWFATPGNNVVRRRCRGRPRHYIYHLYNAHNITAIHVDNRRLFMVPIILMRGSIPSAEDNGPSHDLKGTSYWGLWLGTICRPWCTHRTGGTQAKCIEIYMMTSSNENIFRVTGPLCGEFTGHQLIPLTKASDAELWCFLWSMPA